MRRWSGTAVATAVTLVAAAVLVAGEARDQAKPDRPAGRVMVAVDVGDPGVAQLPDRWIGLGCQPVSEALRAQLALEEDQGLLVDMVAEDSPAAKAGFQRYDVLLAADSKPLGSIQDLVEAVRRAGDKKMSFRLLRQGKEMTIEVTPAERPPEARPRQPFRLRRPPEWKEFERWLEMPFGGPGRRYRFRFFGPGTILPPRVHIETDLPGDVSVTITKKGKQPAKIVVKRGDQTWEVTEDELDQLPEEIRGHVQRMLGQWWEAGPGRVHIWDWVPDWPPEERDIRPPRQFRQGLEKKLEETNRRLRELEKKLNEMRQSTGTPRRESRV